MMVKILAAIRLFFLILRHYLKRFTSPPTNNIMDFLENLGNLISANVDFNNDELEGLVKDTINKSSAVTASALELKALTADDAEADQIAESTNSLIDLAAELGKTFPKLNQTEADRFKTIVDNIYRNADPAKDAAVQRVFNGAVDLVLSTHALRDYVNTPAE